MKIWTIRPTVALIGLILAAGLTGCASVKVEQPQGIADTPQHHYRTGMKLLDEGKSPQARLEFERARALDPDFAPAYEGLGLADLAGGDLEAAEKQMTLAKKKDRNFVAAYVGMGRVLTAKGALKEAVEELQAALQLDPRNVAAHFRLGEAHLKGFAFGPAEDSFSRALELDPGFAPARKGWERSVKIRMAAPGTAIGKRIALAHPITRADLAALIAVELGLEEKLRRRRPELFESGFRSPAAAGAAAALTPTKPGAPPKLVDVEKHWAKNAIELVARLNLLEPFPDQTFRPEAPVSRVALAMVLHEILVTATGEERLRTQFVGGTSPFPDVRSDHFAFNAILLVTTRGLMEADAKSGAFRLTEHVSGADAVLSIKKLAELF